MLLVKRILFLLFWEQRRTRQRAQCNLTCDFSSWWSTKHTGVWQWRQRYGVCCWLWMQSTINTTLLPKALHCFKQAHGRRMEDTPLPSPTQTRLNTCQQQVRVIYHSCRTHSASCRLRPEGLVTSLLAHWVNSSWPDCWQWVCDEWSLSPTQSINTFTVANISPPTAHTPCMGWPFSHLSQGPIATTVNHASPTEKK